MRVLHVVESLAGGGAETLVRELVPRLRRRGIDVAVLSGYGAKLDERQRLALGVPVHEAAKRGRLDLGFALRFTKLIAQSAPDIVHTHGFCGKYWGRACAIAARVPKIVHTEHNPWPQMGFWESPATALLGRRTDALITFSDRTHTFLRGREPLPREVVVIPNGIEIPAPPSRAQRAAARALLQSAPGELAVGMIANLTHFKNHALALDAYAALSPQLRTRMRLHLFGAGPLERPLRAQAQRLGIADGVRFWGFTKDVRLRLPGLDLALTTSTVEAAPISLLEAMGAGVPIVGAPHLGTLDMVRDGETGLITADWSVQALAAALQCAAGDDAWRVRAGAAARDYLGAAFDIETTADRHVALYQRLAQRSPLAA